MKPCSCGSRRFSVEAVYSAKDYIELKDDGSEDFDVNDTEYGDGEWEDHSTVTCLDCGKTMEYSEWANQDEE